jgi:hypothetical protein
MLAYWFLHRPITYEPGVLIGADPTQVNLPRDEPTFDFGDFHLKPLARFTLDARLLHSRVYRFDPGARLVPIDLAVGWGPMSDQQVLDRLHITQSMRFFWYEYQNPPPIPKDQIINHATNIHIIPSTGSWPRVANLYGMARWSILAASWLRQPARTSRRGAVL